MRPTIKIYVFVLTALFIMPFVNVGNETEFVLNDKELISTAPDVENDDLYDAPQTRSGSGSNLKISSGDKVLMPEINGSWIQTNSKNT